MKPILRSLGTANPPLYVTQQQAFEVYSSLFQLGTEERALYQRLLLEGQIQGRYVGLDQLADACETNPDRLNERFLKYARQTGAAAASQALANASLAPEKLGGLVVNTCTGYRCPGLTSYLAEDLKLPHHIRTLDIAGMGCGGALPNLDAACHMALAGKGPVLSIAVEICSATLFMGADPALVVSNCIFGDGAAAAVVQVDDAVTAPGRIRVLDSEAGIFPQYRNQLHYRQEGGRLRNVLTTKVPTIGAKTASEVLQRLLARNNYSQDAIAWWAVHAGGTAVLDQVGRGLGLSDANLQFSREVFRKYGNMSSPTVLFALQEILKQGRPQRGDLGVLLSFGAGFSAFAMLVEFS
ncbi:MAG: 3-oxoacyl-[acyl-carrier-protein] synthase III C-terminal domain-containing protein [bacterium]